MLYMRQTIINTIVWFVQVDKVVQLYETMMTRHSTMIVGPTGGGKTVIIQALAKAQTSLGLPTKIFTLNPKVSIATSMSGTIAALLISWVQSVKEVNCLLFRIPMKKDHNSYPLSRFIPQLSYAFSNERRN